MSLSRSRSLSFEVPKEPDKLSEEEVQRLRGVPLEVENFYDLFRLKGILPSQFGCQRPSPKTTLGDGEGPVFPTMGSDRGYFNRNLLADAPDVAYTQSPNEAEVVWENVRFSWAPQMKNGSYSREQRDTMYKEATHRFSKFLSLLLSGDQATAYHSRSRKESYLILFIHWKSDSTRKEFYRLQEVQDAIAQIAEYVEVRRHRRPSITHYADLEPPLLTRFSNDVKESDDTKLFLETIKFKLPTLLSKSKKKAFELRFRDFASVMRHKKSPVQPIIQRWTQRADSGEMIFSATFLWADKEKMKDWIRNFAQHPYPEAGHRVRLLARPVIKVGFTSYSILRRFKAGDLPLVYNGRVENAKVRTSMKESVI